MSALTLTRMVVGTAALLAVAAVLALSVGIGLGQAIVAMVAVTAVSGEYSTGLPLRFRERPPESRRSSGRPSCPALHRAGYASRSARRSGAWRHAGSWVS